MKSLLFTIALAFVMLPMQAQEKTEKTISLSSLINGLKKQSTKQSTTQSEGEKTLSLSSLINAMKKKNAQEGQQTTQSNSASEPIQTVQSETESHSTADSQSTPALTMTANGIYGEHKVLIGSAISALPKSFAGLYDAYTVSTEDDEGETITTITFTQGGRETMTAIGYDQKTVANIDVSTPNVYVLVGKTYYTCGSKMSSLKNEPGVKVDDNDYGTIVSYQGMFFDEDDRGYICAIHI